MQLRFGVLKPFAVEFSSFFHAADLRPWDLRPKCQMRSNTVSLAILIPATKDAGFETQCHLSGVFKLWKWTKMTGICGLWIRTWSMPCLMRTLKPSHWPLWRPEMLNLDAGTQPASWAKLCSFPFETCFLRLRIRAIPRFHPSDSEEPTHMVSFGDRTSPSRRRWAEGPVEVNRRVWRVGQEAGESNDWIMSYSWVVDI